MAKSKRGRRTQRRKRPGRAESAAEIGAYAVGLGRIRPAGYGNPKRMSKGGGRRRRKR